MRPEHWLLTIPLRLRSLFRSAQADQELDEELRDHLERKTEEYIAKAMAPEEARRQARLELGGVEKVKEECRDARRVNWIQDFVQDLHFGLRMLRKSRGYTAVAVITLALGIGANTAIFTLIDAVLLKMLPVRDPEQLVQLTWTDPHGRPDDTFSYPTFEEFRDRNEVFSGVLAFASLGKVNVGVNGEGQLADGQVVSGNYYQVLGVNALVGRAISPDDDKVPGASPAAVISYDYWRRRFSLDSGVVGKNLTLNGSPFTIVGVTPPEFFGLQAGNSVDVSVPTKMLAQVKPEWSTVGNRSIFKAVDNWWLEIMARTKPSVSEQQALANVETLFEQVKRASLGPGPSDVPQLDQEILNTRIQIEPGSRGLSALRRQFSKPLLILMVVVALVLLIACANVANLLLARATTRRKEIAMRLALGVGRLRLVRQLMTESLLLALCGGALGLLLAFGGTSFLLTLLSGSSNPILLKVDPDVRVLGFTALVSALTGILFGLAPALRGTQLDLAPALKESAGNLGSAGRRPGLGRALVSLQVGLSLVLLIGTGLFIRSLQQLKSLYPGFDPEKVLVVSLDPTLVGYKGVRATNLYKNLLDQVRAMPGVREASLSEYSPMTSEMQTQIVAVQGYTPRPDEDIAVHQNNVGPGYFKTLGIPVLLGREFTDRDAAGAPGVAVINQTMARYYFGTQNPIGKRFGLGPPETAGSLEIVGMVQDAKYNDLREQPPRMAYIPFLQSGAGRMTFEISTATDPASVVVPFREAVRAADKNIPVFNIRTLTQQVDESLVQEGLVATLSGLFGLLALLLACIGLYGIMSHTVVRRTNEIGIRMALGAWRAEVLWMVMREALILVAGGLAIGLPAALAMTRLISSQLYGLKPTDPTTIAGATLVLVGVATFASYVPARRAMRVDPTVALRYE
jgi:predicted permease